MIPTGAAGPPVGSAALFQTARFRGLFLYRRWDGSGAAAVPDDLDGVGDKHFVDLERQGDSLETGVNSLA